MTTRLASLFLAVILAGCAVGPDYHPPKIETPTQWSSPMTGGETNSPVADPAWWKSFHDAELESLITRAAQSNLEVHAAVARLRQARTAARIVAADYGPSVNAGASYNRQLESKHQPILGSIPIPANVPFENNVYQAGFDASWELDIFGGTRRAVEAAKAETEAAEFARRNILISVYAEVARNYIEARAYQRRLSVANDNIKAQSQILDLTRSLFNHGLTGALDVRQAEALLASSRAQVPQFETGFQSAVYHLSLLLGQPPGALLDELTNAAPLPALPPKVPVGLPSDLVQRRPDVRQAERELAAATARVGIATADLYPKFSLTGDVGQLSVSASDWFESGSRYWQFGPTVQWQIFASGRIRGNIQLQDARVEQARDDYEETMLSAFTDVETALTAYAREQIRRESLARAAEANKQAVSLADDLYSKGLTDFLRVLESERALFQSQDELIDSDRAVCSDLIALYKALGGDWEPEPKAKPLASNP